MWEAWIIHHHHGRDQHWSTNRRSSGRRQKLVSTQIPFYVLVGWNTDREPQKEDGKAKLKISRSMPHTKTQLDSMEKQLDSSGKILQDLRHWLFFKRSRKTWSTRTSIQPEMIKIASLKLRKSRITPLDFSRSRVGKEMVWGLYGGQWDRTVNKMVQ